MNTLTMARKKKELTPNRQLAQAILDQYQPKSVEDMQDALKNIALCLKQCCKAK